MSKISELSDGGSLVSSDYLIAVRSGGNVKVRMDSINVDQVDLGDNEFIRLGNSQDLTMVHTSTQSIINQAGIGDLLLQKAGTTKASITANGLEFPDNSKAIFGAGSDLSLYHVGGNSYVLSNTGSLVLRSDSFRVLNTANSEQILHGDANGAVTAYYDNAVKLATSASGISVTGTVTADGLTVDGVGSFSSTAPYIDLFETDTTDLNSRIVSNSSSLRLQTVGDDGSGSINRLLIDHATGDISFYEDTGTTPKFFWDASAESLGIGGNGVGNGLGVYLNKGAVANFYEASDGTKTMIAGTDAGNDYVKIGSLSAHPVGFVVGNGEKVRLDASGNLLVGTSLNNPTSSGVNVAGQEFSTTGGVRSTVESNAAATFNRKTDDGAIALFRKDGTTVGSIGSHVNGLLIGTTEGSDAFLKFESNAVRPSAWNGSYRDAAIDLGHTSSRFKDLYLSGGMQLSRAVTSETEIESYNNTDSGGAKYKISFKQNGTQVGVIEVGTSSTNYITSSDYRLKQNVVGMSGATERLKQLKPSRFNFIADADTTVDGFLAHEVQDIVPEAISGTKDAMRDEEYEVTPAVLDDDGNVVTEAVMGTRSVPDYQGIDQSKLVPLLVATIQELEARIAALES